MKKLLSLLLLTVGLCQAAIGQTNYLLSLTGSGTRIEDGSFCYPQAPNWPACSQPQAVTWEGTLTVTTIGAADGTYSGKDLLAVSLSSSLSNFWTDGDNSNHFALTKAPVSVTVVDGLVSSLDFSFAPGPYEQFHFGGLSASYFYGGGGCHHCGSTYASATLAPIPEPSTYAMMVIGLAALAYVARRRRPVR
jgi:hypothetical protein